MLQLPTRIGKYELEKFLGGGMSHVYRARDTVIGRTVAVKILTVKGVADPEFKERFLAEARVVGSIVHDNVLRIYDCGEDERHGPFMVMEFLEGEDLGEAIRNSRLGNLKNKLTIAGQVARALEHVHERKVVHRDIKPENVHLNSSGRVKLMDFGIAKTEGPQLTRAGYFVGTAPYSSPEQVRGEKPTLSVDVYAFGLLLFEMLTGTRAVDGKTHNEIFYKILNEPISLEPLRQAGVPEALCSLVDQCVAKTVADRPTGFSTIRRELDRFIENDIATEQRRTIEQPKPNRLITPVASIAVAAVLCVALWPRPKPLPLQISTLAGEMMLVGGGEFLFGEKLEVRSQPSFYIDQTEVTNRAYAAFCRARSRPLPAEFLADQLDFPVVSISIQDARDFAHWAGKRLPTSMEWEKAARGTKGQKYTWGDGRNGERANICLGAQPLCNQQVAEGQLRVGRALGFQNGQSPYGALQMIGNVWEFVEQAVQPDASTLQLFPTLYPRPSTSEEWYMIRGQSFAESLSGDVLWDHMPVPARWKDKLVGFRCVKDIASEQVRQPNHWSDSRP